MCADHRLVNSSAAGPLLRGLRSRVLPDHWSLLFGQIAFHSFIVVTLSGVFLMFFYEPSTAPVTYDGSYAPLQGVEMSRAFDSTLDLSFEGRGGLLMRQVHHWSALLMIASIMLHLLRLFFTGGFRRPRVSSWVVVFLLLVMAMGAGFTGHSLPDDMRSGTSLAVLDGVLKATPFVGVWLSSLLFGGPFPGDVLALFYPLHVVVLPAAMVVLFAAQAILAVHHKPAQFPGPGRAEDNIVGRPAPILAVKGVGLFFIVFGVVVVMAATFTVNPVWTSGPADPASAPAGSGPEWYLAVFDGALRLVPPGWEFEWLGKTWTLAVLVPVAVVTIFFLLVAGYPFLERRVTGDRRRHHLVRLGSVGSLDETIRCHGGHLQGIVVLCGSASASIQDDRGRRSDASASWPTPRAGRPSTSAITSCRSPRLARGSTNPCWSHGRCCRPSVR